MGDGWLTYKPGALPFHGNDVMEIVRGIGGDLVEDVALIDEFTHPKTGLALRACATASIIAALSGP